MEGVLVSAATGALKPVLEKLSSLAGDEYKRFKGLRREVQSLSAELAAMHMFLLKMSEEENPDVQDKAWMKEVRELSYDMEDSLDEFRHRVDDKTANPDGLIDKFKNFLSKAKARRRVAKAIEDIKVQIKEVGDRNRRYRSNDIFIRTSNNAAVDRRALEIFEDASKLVGVDGPKNELVKLLKNDGWASSTLKVVSIVGLGGMGKTTVANQVYLELKGEYDCHAFVTVSRNPDIMKVLRNILCQVNNEPHHNIETWNIQLLIRKIIISLEHKRYLIVIDNVWDAEAWGTIKCLLANKARNGSHIIKEWEKVETSIGHGLERDASVKGMMEILSLSYFDLPCHLKACLLYLSIFPEDYPIEKDCLVRRWVAEGFVCAESTYSMYESGERCFNELVNRSLVLPWNIDYISGEVQICCVHDTILDFIVSKSTEENFVTVHRVPRQTPPPGNKVRRLILQGQTEGDATLLSDQIYSNVQSFITFGLLLGDSYSFLDFRFIRVLDMKKCQSLENHHLTNIGELVLLKYLRVRTRSITELPEQIGKLQYLETLDLPYSNITKLPATILRLENLVNLRINRTSCRNMPGGIRSMQALEVLETIYVDQEAPVSFLEEIGKLTKLRKLCMLWSGSIQRDLDKASYKESVKWMISSVQRLNNLETLDAQIESNGDAIDLEENNAMPQEPWFPVSVRKLVFGLCCMPRIPSWLKSLIHLQILDVLVKQLDQESLCTLGDLPVLAGLSLLIVKSLNSQRPTAADEARLKVSCRSGYTSLRHFNIMGAGEGRSISLGIPMVIFEAGSMPKLERVRIDVDADITISVTDDRLDFGLQHLSHLTSFNCYVYGSKINTWRVEAVIRKALYSHPKAPGFMIDRPCYARTTSALNERVRLRML
ncbi:unnamed protein product [Urochloa decumbens]|uniref:Uncharacterized protein n=1 Tax=Urochloa decumbens TaxID=240449 RepID=A0ABC9BTR5_9POAL